jgi:hypothetical protein
MEIMPQFKKSQKQLNDNGIYIQHNDGSVCGILMFKTEDLINYLNKDVGGSGLTRLQNLSKLLNQEGLGGIDYCAEKSVNKWAIEHENLFEDLTEEHQSRICGFDCFVYVNNYGKGGDKELDDYVREEGGYTEEEIKEGERYNDGMLWYWVGEY